MGQEPDASVYPDLPRVQMTVTTVAGSNAGLNEDSEVIMTAVLGTNSGAQEGTVRLLVNKLSFNSSVFSKEYSLEIRGEFTLAGIKQSLLEEAIERQSGDSALQANIDVEKARIDAILQASDADKDSFAEIVNLINSVDTENDSAFASYVLSNDAALAQEVSDRKAADESLQQQIGDISSGLINSLAQETSNREAADITLQSNIDAEVNARESADMFLQTQISTEKSRIDAILDASDADKDSFAEIVNLINSVDTENDTAFAGYVSSNDARVSTLESEMDAVELSVTQETLAREAADEALQSQIDSLVQFAKEAIEVTAQMISDTYVDLQVEIKPNSMVMFVDRLGMHEGLDYSVSTVNGVSRITFLSPMLEPSEEAIEAGQFIRVTYAK